MEEASAAVSSRTWGISRNVFFLGLVSFLTDVSSEMIFTILPLFLTNVLGAGAAIVGLVTGVSESTATFLKLASGWLSDRLGKRKTLAALGYGLSAISKPFLYLATSWGVALAVRFSDRVGKGIRTSPRDALLADSSEQRVMGRSFGFHRAMDSFGAVVGLAGAALIILIMQRGDRLLDKASFQALVIVGTIPALLAVLLLLLLVREVKVERAPGGQNAALPSSSISPHFKPFLLIMVLFSLGSSTEAFLVLRAQDLGLSVAEILLALVAFNVVYTLAATPAGVLSDRWGRKRVMVAGWTVYALTYLGFALAGEAWQVWPLLLFYGLYFGATEGVARAFVADVVPKGRRGAGYGLYHGSLGVSALLAGVIAGFLWQGINPSAPFFFGAALAGASVLLFLAYIPERARPAASQ